MLCLSWLAASGLAAESPVTVRVQNFLVPPATGPVVGVVVRNLGPQAYAGRLSVRFPAGWRVTPETQAVVLDPGEHRTLSLAIERGLDVTANAYPVSVSLENSDGAHAWEQRVVCASTPVFEPKVDGNLKEWTDAIPIAFRTDGKATSVRSYWNRQAYCLAVEVEEDQWIGLKKSSAEVGLDAIQFALAPVKSVTGGADGNTSVRYEFLVASAGSAFGRDKCFQLLKPGDPLARCTEARPLAPLECRAAEVAVKRTRTVTRYEVALPFSLLPALRPTPGREYCFSLLVHDAAGTGLRDLGTVMNLTDRDRHPRAWSSWDNARWPELEPFDNKIEFGFCSSIH